MTPMPPASGVPDGFNMRPGLGGDDNAPESEAEDSAVMAQSVENNPVAIDSKIKEETKGNP